MSPLDMLFEPVWQRLTWTLLHFLWQGLALAMLLLAAFWLFRVRQARTRYALGLLTMVAVAVCPVVTFAVLEVSGGSLAGVGWGAAERSPTTVPIEVGLRPTLPPPPIARPLHRPASSSGDRAPLPNVASAASKRQPTHSERVSAWNLSIADYVHTVQPYLLVGWIAGVLLLSARLLLAQAGVHWMGRGRRPVSTDLSSCVSRLGGRLGLRTMPRVFASERIREAIVVGLLRPIVLLPACWLAEMTPEVLEAVLAHELAHLRRWDLWVNLFQRLVETLLFYHPAVWWLSRRIRLEREMCCDELAVAATGQRATYATVLELVGRRQLTLPRPELGAAMGGNKMALLSRVRNVLGVSPSQERVRLWPAGLLAVLVLLALWLNSTGVAQPEPGKTRAAPAEEQPVVSPALSAESVMRRYREAVWAEVLPKLDRLESRKAMETMERIASETTAKHIMPHRDMLARHFLDQLPKADPIDRSQWTAGEIELSDELEKGLDGGDMQRARFVLWNPVDAAHCWRAAALAKTMGTAIYGKRALLQMQTPTRSVALDSDLAHPVIAMATGDELFVVGLRRTEQGLYTPSRLQWLKKKPGATQDYCLLAPDASPAQKLLQVFGDAVWAELAPKLKTMETEDLQKEIGKLAGEQLAPHKDVLAAEAERILKELPKSEAIDRSQWRPKFPDFSAKDLDDLQGAMRGEALKDEHIALAFGAWHPVRMAAMIRLRLTAQSLGPAALGVRSMLETIASPPVNSVADADPNHPVIVSRAGDELMTIGLRRNQEGWYELDRLEWLQRLGPGRPPARVIPKTNQEQKATAKAAEIAPYRVEPFDLVSIKALGTLLERPIDQTYLVEPSGRVSLGPAYGRLELKGLTIEEAERAITKHLRKVLANPMVQVSAAGRVTRFRRAVLPKAPYRISPRDSLNIRVAGTLADQPIGGTYAVEPSGQVPLGPAYGRVRVSSLTLEQAEDAIQQHLQKVLRQPEVSVTMANWRTVWREAVVPEAPYRIATGDLLDIHVVGTLLDQPIDTVAGAHLVEPSGRVALGPAYGRVQVKGLTFKEAEDAIDKHLEKLLAHPEVSVTLAGWNGSTETEEEILGLATRPATEADERIAWGEAVDGIRCGVRPVKAALAPDEDLVVDVLYRNVSQQPITVCVHPDPFYTWVHLRVDTPEGMMALAGQHGSGAYRPLKARDFVTLAPGQAGSFRQVIAHRRKPEIQLKPGRPYVINAEINKINRMDRHLLGLEEFCKKHGIPRPWCSGIESGRAPLTIVPRQPAKQPSSAAASAVPLSEILVMERVERLYEHIKWFSIDISYQGPGDGEFYDLRLIVTKAGGSAGPPKMVLDLPGKQASSIIDFLRKDGFLLRARNPYRPGKIPPPSGPAYTITVNDAYQTLYEDLGWGAPMVTRLKSLRAVLAGEPAKAMDKLLALLEPYRKKWEEEATAQPAVQPVPGVEYYRKQYAWYKQWILKAVKAGDKDQVLKITQDFNQSIEGRLLFVRVTRIDPPAKYDTLINMPFGEKRVSLPNIHYAKLEEVHVTKWDGYVLLETGKNQDRTYTDNVYITMALESKAAGRADELKAAIDKFRLAIWYCPEQPDVHYNLTLSVPTAAQAPLCPFHGSGGKQKDQVQIVPIGRDQAAKILDHLAAEGFLDASRNVQGMPLEPCGFPATVLAVDGPEKTTLREQIGWRLPMLKRLDALRKVLEGDAAKAMDQLLAGLQGHRKQWEKATATQPTGSSGSKAEERPGVSEGSSASGDDPAWSKPVGNLSGRLVFAKTRITASEFFQVNLQLRNVGTSPLAVQTGNPFALNMEVKDQQGNLVKPTWNRVDVWAYPKWAVLSPGSPLSFQVGFEAIDGAKGAHLDTVTDIWKLQPGKYTVLAKYSSKGFFKDVQGERPGSVWEGEISLPPIEVEVTQPGPILENTTESFSPENVVPDSNPRHQDARTPAAATEDHPRSNTANSTSLDAHRSLSA